MDTSFGKYIIKWCLVPSLQHTAAVTIITVFLNHPDTRKVVIAYSGSTASEFFHALTVDDLNFYNVSSKIAKLPIPERIQYFLRKFITPVLANLYNWITYQDQHIFSTWSNDSKSRAISYLDEVVWLSRGTINYPETAKNLIKAASITCDEKYRIACHYCLEEEIAENAVATSVAYLTSLTLEQSPQEYYFACQLTGDFETFERKTREYNRQRGTEYTLREIVLIFVNHQDFEFKKYLWRQFTAKERTRNAARFVGGAYKSELLWYLFLHMDEEQQRRAINENFLTIFRRLIMDPLWLDCVLPFVFYIWDKMTEREFCKSLTWIPFPKKCAENVGLYDHYVYVFQEMWKAAPKHFRHFAFEHNKASTAAYVLHELLWERNGSLVELILSHGSRAQRKEILYSDYGLELCATFVMRNQWNLFGLFTESVFATEADVEEFKRVFGEKHGQQIARYCEENDKRDFHENYLKWCGESLEERTN